MNKKKIVISAIKDIISLVPYGSPIIREWDSYDINKRFKSLESEIEKVWKAIKSEDALPYKEILKIANKTAVISEVNLRKMESCMQLIEKINIESKLGWEWDPELDAEECIELSRKRDDIKKPEREFELVVYELNRINLINKVRSVSEKYGICTIGPTFNFFCRTDRFFQKWNPENDAKKIIKKIIDKELKEVIYPSELNKELRWKPRRLNSSLAFLDYNSLISHTGFGGATDYILNYMTLNEEAHFFIDDDD